MTERTGIARSTVVIIYKLALVSGFAIGATVIATSLLRPELPQSAISLIMPADSAKIAGLLRVSQKTLLLLYGTLMVGVTMIMHSFTRAFTHSLARDSKVLKRKTLVRFLAAASFTAGFLGARTMVALSGIVGASSAGIAGFIPIQEVWFQGYHIHHFFFGFTFLALAGWIAIFHESYSKKLVAVLYGLGLGIFTDELGMLLTGGNYFALSSYVAAVVFTSVFVAGFYWDVAHFTMQD